MAFPEPKFKKGNLVRLISGGPEMFVEKVSGDLVTCTWKSDMGRRSEVFAHLFRES